MNKVQAELECKHTIHLTVNSETAKIGEEGYCRYDGWQTIMVIHTHQWRVICLRCRFGRWCGQSKSGAYRNGASHEYLKPGHVTRVFYDRVTASGGTPRKYLAKSSRTVHDGATMAKTYGEPPF